MLWHERDSLLRRCRVFFRASKGTRSAGGGRSSAVQITMNVEWVVRMEHGRRACE